MSESVVSSHSLRFHWELLVIGHLGSLSPLAWFLYREYRAVAGDCAGNNEPLSQIILCDGAIPCMAACLRGSFFRLDRGFFGFISTFIGVAENIYPTAVFD